MLNQLHFLHPLWLLSLIPLAGLLWLLYQQRRGNSAWSKVIDANLLPLLLKGSENKTSRIGILLLAIAWFISVIALADPVWEKIPRPIFQTNAARVIVLDLSRSMLIPDLKPSRLARARFKIKDILTRNEEGQTGLVVFAGAGFTVAPLTRDTETLRSLLQVLKPNIMPAQGSRADLGLLKAQELLQQANIKQGQVLLIADGVVGKKAAIAAKQLYDNGYTVSVLAVGTEAGGLIPNLRQNITVKLETEALQAVAKQGGGTYQLISNNNDDLQQLLNPLKRDKTQNDNAQQSVADLQNQDWKSNAPYLILLLLPLAAFAFRRGWLFTVLCVVGLFGLTVQPQTVYANDANSHVNSDTKNTAEGFSFKSAWTNLWQRQDQQADKALQQQQYQQALELSKDPLRRGSAEYRQGDYAQALKSFTEATGANANYNRGNTLAKLGKYQDAIKAYNKTLQQDKNHADAKANKATVKKILKEQKQQKKNKDNKEKSNDGDKKGDKNKDQNKKENKEQQNADNKSEEKKGDKNKNGEKKEGQQGDKSKDNQFSDAAKQLENNKKSEDKEGDQQLDKADTKESDNKKEQKKTEKQNADSKQKNASNNADDNNHQQMSGTKTEAEELSKEEKIAAEQWLRRIPDDPGGLLRRKFLRQYRQHAPQRRGPADNTNFW